MIAKHSSAMTLTKPSDRELVVTRVFEAPRSLVWEAWTSPDHMPHWMLGPEGWTMPVCEIDLHPGGAWHIVWRRADGTEMEMRGMYKEIVPPERLVSTESWGGDWPETINTVDLSEDDGVTTLTLTILYASKEVRDRALQTGMTEGMSVSFDRLADHLATIAGGAGPAEPELVLTRVIDAPRELVWKAWTDPEHFVRWWGPKHFTTPHCAIDLRPGGVMHFCMRSPEGQDFWCGGVFREIVEPKRLVVTDYFSDADGRVVQPAEFGMPDWPAETLLTVTFEEHEGKTRMTMRQSVPLSLAERYKAVQGWSESFDKLAEHVATAREA